MKRDAPWSTVRPCRAASRNPDANPVRSQTEPSRKRTEPAAPPRPQVQLRVKVHGRHPWFFRKMVRRPEPPIPAGTPVDVRDKTGRPVGVGFYNSRCDLALRMLPGSRVGADPGEVLARLLDQAIALRTDVLGLPRVADVWRLVHAEGDGFPGLVLDVLGRSVVGQLFSLGMQRQAEAIGEHLLRWRPDLRLVLTQDRDAAEREGMEPLPRPHPAREVVSEHGLRYAVLPGLGHKTGFFADQRDNRQRIRGLARGRRVLDLFCNAGGFGLNALAGGAASVFAADLDEDAVERTRENIELNSVAISARRTSGRCEIDPNRIDVAQADAFDLLRDVEPGAYDLIVVDPPKWAAGASQVDAAIARYEDINRLAFRAVERGGLVATFSCSGALSESRFLAALRAAASAAGRDVRVLETTGAGPDHPVALEVPQTRYLKGAFLQVR